VWPAGTGPLVAGVDWTGTLRPAILGGAAAGGTGLNRGCRRHVLTSQRHHFGHLGRTVTWMLPGMQQAKRPVSAYLAGAYGHPFHPALASVPVGAWVSSLVFDVASHAVSKPGFLAAGAEWLIAIGIVGGVAAALAGFLDLAVIPPGTRVYRTACAHVSINALVISGYVVDFALRKRSYQLGAPVSLDMLTLSAACLVLLTASGYLGGRLAYRFGVRVADEDAQADGYRTRTGHAAQDDPQSDAVKHRRPRS